MFQYLEKLRNKPEGERRKTVLIISVGITLLIALVWSFTFYMSIDGTDFSLKEKTVSENNKNIEKTPSLSETLSNFMNQVGNIIQNSTTYENAIPKAVTAE